MKRLALLLAACGAAHPTHTPPPPDAAPIVKAPRDIAPPDPPAPGLRLPTTIAVQEGWLRLELDPKQPEYSGVVDYTITGDGATDVIWLDADPDRVTIASASIGGVELARLSTSTGDQVGFRAPDTISRDPVKLELRFTAKAGDEPDGIFAQTADGKAYLFSQGEAIQERKAFPCFDEPRFKFPWNVTLVVPADDHAYSNSPEASASQTDDGRVAHEFARTYPLPSYLVTFAVGPFDEVDVGPVGQKKIAARMIVTAGRGAEAATTKAWIPKMVGFLEDYMGEPLPFDKLDVVSVPNFPGLMEDPGIIMASADSVLVDAAHLTPDFASNLFPSLGHELAHFWFGDDVTMAWWDDLWLNESFATWMAGEMSAKLDVQYDRTADELGLANGALSSDARMSTRALRRPITSQDQIEGSFDAIAYSKGGTLLTQLEATLGADTMKKVIRAYIAAHARGNATTDDFIDAIATNGSQTAADAFKSYVDQAGAPVVTATLDCKAKALHLHQERLVGFGETAPAQTWTIHVCAQWKGGNACTDLAAADGDIPLGSCPAWIDPDASPSYARILPDAASLASLAKHAKEVPLADRMRLASDLGPLMLAGKVSVADAESMVAPLVATKDPHDLSSAIGLVESTLGLVGPDQQPAWRKWVMAHFGKAAKAAPLAPPKKESAAAHDARLALLELVGVAARDPATGARARKLLGPWIAGQAAPPRDYQALVAIAATDGDAKLFDTMLARAHATTGDDQRAFLLGLGAFDDPALMAKADEVTLDAAFDPLSSFEILGPQSSTDDGKRAVSTFVRAHWDDLVKRIPVFIRGGLVQVAATCDPDDRAALGTFVTAHAKEITDADRVIADTLAKSDACIARRKTMADDVATWLKM